MKTLIYFMLLIGVLSCKKDKNTLTENGTFTWNDTQKVRILKVEQTESPNSFPFDIDALMTVEYIYVKGVLTGIKVHRGESSYNYPNTAISNGSYEFDLNDDPAFGGIFSFKKLSLNTGNERLISAHNHYKYNFPWADGPTLDKDAAYTYSSTGLLKNINITGFWSNSATAGIKGKGTDIQTETYDNGLLKNYSVVNYVSALIDSPVIGQELDMQVTYQAATGVPDGLIRYVNQAILGLNQFGFEDYFYHMKYDLRLGTALVEDDDHAGQVAKYNHTFADWIVSFGLSNTFNIPNQGNQLIYTKHATGKKIIDGQPESEDGLTPVQYEYGTVDFSSSYPYVHNAAEKTLEIAGLKIYYDWVDNNYTTPVDTIPTPEFNTITDSRDGQKYKIVTIGTQTWFGENLRYAGDFPNITDDQEWRDIFTSKSATAAWCYYDNLPVNDAIYGKLYNWHAVNTGTLCPDGWHIPTEDEWTILNKYLGGEKVAGGNIKSLTNHWNTPNTGATNVSGFNGLPGGYRQVTTNPSYRNIGNSGHWWGSTEVGPRYGPFHTVMYNTSELSNSYNFKEYGYSCRCIKD